MGPLEIINGPLMEGMKEVGRLFNANELIVAEVLQSAEAMKAAVSHLEKFMEKATDARKGRSSSRRSRGTCTTSGRTWSRSSSPTTATRSSTSGSRCLPRS
jgi:cobalamin-dependent methionine synthase I